MVSRGLAALAWALALGGGCGDDDGPTAAESTSTGAAASSGSTTASPPRPPAGPTVDDFVSACVVGFPDLPRPIFDDPDPVDDEGTGTGGALGTSSGAASTGLVGSSGEATFGTSTTGTTGASADSTSTTSTAGTTGAFAESTSTTGTAVGEPGVSSSGTTGDTTTTGGRAPQAAGEAAGPLRETGHLVGVAIAAHRLRTPEYVEVAASQFNYVTPENEMKWETIERFPGEFDFRGADMIVEFARANDMKVKGHTLVWHSQLPSWVEELEGATAVREAMERHIRETMAHFQENHPGMVIAWDVVNEAIESEDGVVSFRDSVFYRALGEDFIAEAFELAKAQAPDVLLFYNDYGIESLSPKSQATYEMIRRLVERGVPIDGVGFQMHTTSFDWGPTREDFEQNLQRYIDLGLVVNISEMDVSLCRGFETREEAWAAQRERVRQMAGTCLQFEACESVTFWGVADRDSWLNSYLPCDDERFEPWPLLFDDDYRPKPAWYGAYDAMTGCLTWPEPS